MPKDVNPIEQCGNTQQTFGNSGAI